MDVCFGGWVGGLMVGWLSVSGVCMDGMVG